jgi:hypothetical protein
MIHNKNQEKKVEPHEDCKLRPSSSLKVDDKQELSPHHLQHTPVM